MEVETSWIIQLGGPGEKNSIEHSFVNLEYNFMKFGNEVNVDVNRQDQKYISPGGTHGEHFQIIEQMWKIWQPYEEPL